MRGRQHGRSGAGLAAFVLVASLLPLFLSGSAHGAVTVRAYLVPDLANVDPGDVVRYTVSLDGSGSSGPANRVWANVTLDPAMTHIGDNAFMIPGACCPGASGIHRYYNFTNLASANNTFWLDVQIGVGPPDGAMLRLRMAVNYTDDTGVPQPEITASASVAMVIPKIVVTKTPTVTPVDPGGALSYTIQVRNVGSATANTIWMNDTLPPEVSFVGVSNIPPPRCTAEDCRITNIGPGQSQAYNIDVLVRTTAVRGTAFTNWMFADFTDDDGTVLAQVSASAVVEIRAIRDLSVDKVADASLAYPGALVAFTIWYNNTASTALGAAWINDTLPAGMAHNASTPPATVSSGTVRWQFTNIAPGPHSVDLVVAIGSTVADGAVLTNTAGADYVDSKGQPGVPVASSSTILVSTSLPRFDGFAKIADVVSVTPAGTVHYTVYYNNTGTNTSAEVVIEDNIPPKTVLANPSVPWATVVGQRYRWRFTDVGTGPHQLTYELVLQGVTADTNLVNFAFLNYTDPSGRTLPSPPTRSAVVWVEAGGGGRTGDDPSVLIAVLLLLLTLGGIVGYRLLLGTRGTVIDEVFLLHKDGLLIKHYTRRVRPDVDSDILSGMLIVVQNFVNESFIGSEGLQKEGQLDELRFGEFKLVIERGQWVIVAAVLSGDPTNRVKDQVKAAIRDLEAALTANLDGWAGDMKAVEGADRFMQDLIVGKYARAWGKG